MPLRELTAQEQQRIATEFKADPRNFVYDEDLKKPAPRPRAMMPTTALEAPANGAGINSLGDAGLVASQGVIPAVAAGAAGIAAKKLLPKILGKVIAADNPVTGPIVWAGEIASMLGGAGTAAQIQRAGMRRAMPTTSRRIEEMVQADPYKTMGIQALVGAPFMGARLGFDSLKNAAKVGAANVGIDATQQVGLEGRNLEDIDKTRLAVALGAGALTSAKGGVKTMGIARSTTGKVLPKAWSEEAFGVAPAAPAPRPASTSSSTPRALPLPEQPNWNPTYYLEGPYERVAALGEFGQMIVTARKAGVRLTPEELTDFAYPNKNVKVTLEEIMRKHGPMVDRVDEGLPIDQVTEVEPVHTSDPTTGIRETQERLQKEVSAETEATLAAEKQRKVQEAAETKNQLEMDRLASGPTTTLGLPGMTPRPGTEGSAAESAAVMLSQKPVVKDIKTKRAELKALSEQIKMQDDRIKMLIEAGEMNEAGNTQDARNKNLQQHYQLSNELGVTEFSSPGIEAPIAPGQAESLLKLRTPTPKPEAPAPSTTAKPVPPPVDRMFAKVIPQAEVPVVPVGEVEPVISNVPEPVVAEVPVAKVATPAPDAPVPAATITTVAPRDTFVGADGVTVKIKSVNKQGIVSTVIPGQLGSNKIPLKDFLELVNSGELTKTGEGTSGKGLNVKVDPKGGERGNVANIPGEMAEAGIAAAKALRDRLAKVASQIRDTARKNPVVLKTANYWITPGGDLVESQVFHDESAAEILGRPPEGRGWGENKDELMKHGWGRVVSEGGKIYVEGKPLTGAQSLELRAQAIEQKKPLIWENYLQSRGHTVLFDPAQEVTKQLNMGLPPDLIKKISKTPGDILRSVKRQMLALHTDFQTIVPALEEMNVRQQQVTAPLKMKALDAMEGLSKEEKTLVSDYLMELKYQGRSSIELTPELAERAALAQEVRNEVTDLKLEPDAPLVERFRDDGTSYFDKFIETPHFMPEAFSSETQRAMKGKDAGARESALQKQTDWNIEQGMPAETARKVAMRQLESGSVGGVPHATFQGMRLSEGRGIHPELRMNTLDALVRYAQRVGMDTGFHKAIELQPEVAGLFGLETDGSGNPIPEQFKKDFPWGKHQLVTDVMAEYAHALDPDSRYWNSAQHFAQTAAVGTASQIINIPQSLPVMAEIMGGRAFARHLTATVRDLRKRGISAINREAMQEGAIRTSGNLTQREVADAANGMDLMAEGLSKWTGSEAVDKSHRALIYSIYKPYVRENLTDVAMLNRFGPINRERFTDEELVRYIANRLTGHTAGRYDWSQQPSWTLGGKHSFPKAMASLSRYGIGRYNEWVEGPVAQAKNGDIGPLIRSLLVGFGSAEMVNWIREELNGRKPPELSPEEFLNLGGKDAAYTLFSKMNTAGNMGILGSLVFDGIKVKAGEKPNLFSNLGVEAGWNLKERVGQWMTANKEGVTDRMEPIDLGGLSIIAGETFRDLVQSARLVFDRPDENNTRDKMVAERLGYIPQEPDSKRISNPFSQNQMYRREDVAGLAGLFNNRRTTGRAIPETPDATHPEGVYKFIQEARGEAAATGARRASSAIDLRNRDTRRRALAEMNSVSP